MFKFIFALFGLVVIYTIILFLIPIFQFVGFVSDRVNEVQNIFQEMEKRIEDLKWKKELQSTPKDDSSV